MSKTIKLTDDTYKQLEALLRPRETFNQAVVRLLRVYNTFFAVKETLGPSHHVNERPKQEVK